MTRTDHEQSQTIIFKKQGGILPSPSKQVSLKEHLGSGMFADVWSVETVSEIPNLALSRFRAKKELALKLYENPKMDKLKYQKLIHFYCKLFGVQTYDNFDIVKIISDDDIKKYGLLMDNLATQDQIAFDTYSFENKLPTPNQIELIKSVNMEKVVKDLEKIARRASWAGVWLSIDCFLLHISKKGIARPVVADFDALRFSDDRKKILKSNLRDANETAILWQEKIQTLLHPTPSANN